jgi:hypothetical protein
MNHHPAEGLARVTNGFSQFDKLTEEYRSEDQIEN